MSSHETEPGTRPTCKEGHSALIDQDGDAHSQAIDNSILPDAPTARVEDVDDSVAYAPALSDHSDNTQQDSVTTSNILVGAPVARHDNVHHSSEDPDGALSVDGRSLDVVSVASAADGPRDGGDGADHVQQPHQPAQLATEQDLEPDVRRIPRPLRRQTRRNSIKYLTKYVL